MSATPKKKYLQIFLSISDGDTLETVAVKAAKLITSVTREGFDTAKADDGYAVRFICERMETLEETAKRVAEEEAERVAYETARENDFREAEWTIAKTRTELDRIAMKYSSHPGRFIL